MVDSAVRDAPELLFTGLEEGATTDRLGQTGAPSPTPGVENGTSSTPTGDGESSATKNSKYLMVDDRQFYVVAATMQVLGMVIDYLRIAVNLPSLNMECMSRLIEFLKVRDQYLRPHGTHLIGTQAFNSRVGQVVLGAGAMRSAGLRNITARHLGMPAPATSSS